jgi:hypothetical protein
VGEEEDACMSYEEEDTYLSSDNSLAMSTAQVMWGGGCMYVIWGGGYIPIEWQLFGDGHGPRVQIVTPVPSFSAVHWGKRYVTWMSYEEEDTCMSYEEDTWGGYKWKRYVTWMSYEEEDTYEEEHTNVSRSNPQYAPSPQRTEGKKNK